MLFFLELSQDRKQLIVDLKREGHRNCEIVKLLHIPESTIRSIWKKYNSTGNVENIPRVGRPRKVTRRGEVRLLRTVKKNRGKVLREITNDFNEGGVVRVHQIEPIVNSGICNNFTISQFLCPSRFKSTTSCFRSSLSSFGPS
jgi:transposase